MFLKEAGKSDDLLLQPMLKVNLLYGLLERAVDCIIWYSDNFVYYRARHRNAYLTPIYGAC